MKQKSDGEKVKVQIVQKCTNCSRLMRAWLCISVIALSLYLPVAIWSFNPATFGPRISQGRILSSEREELRLHHMREYLYESKWEKALNNTDTIQFFTHNRRTGGSTLESHIILPLLPASRTLNCIEGSDGRYYQLPTNDQDRIRERLTSTTFQYRHCPYGLHDLISENRTHIYMTILRRPRQRLESWASFCMQQSSSWCRTIPWSDVKKGDSLRRAARAKNALRGATAFTFYQERLKLWETIRDQGKGFAYHDPYLPRDRHPDMMEYMLDDNYQVRMICGPEAHGHPYLVNSTHLECAMRNLLTSYYFVGIAERFNETLCLAPKLLHLDVPEKAFQIAEARKGEQTTKRVNRMDTESRWPIGNYSQYDDQLYDLGMAIFEHHLDMFPECRLERNDTSSSYAERYRLPPHLKQVVHVPLDFLDKKTFAYGR